MNREESSIAEMDIGDKGIIRGITAQGEIRRRLLDMGLVPGVRFKILRVAPLGDPIELHIRGFHLSLRREEALGITAAKIGRQGDRKPLHHGRRHHHRRHAYLYPEDLPSSRKREAPHAEGAPENPSMGKPEKPASEAKTITVALLGNPNCGKTSLFNALAGANQRVGNFTGVTVESYEGTRRYEGYTIRIVDLPGIYSLTAYSPEEVVSRNYLIENRPDLVIDVLDGTNLERNLYLTTQLMEMESDLLVALNMYDEVQKQKIKVDIHQLQKLLGSHVIPTSAKSGEGVEKLLSHIVRVYEGKIAIDKNKLTYSPEVEEGISRLAEILSHDEELAEYYSPRWLAAKLLENDQLVYETIKERSIWIRTEIALKEIMKSLEKNERGDSELAVTEDRHAFIRGAAQETIKQPEETPESFTDKIDKVFLNRFLGIPLFLGMMWLLFQFTFTVGQYPAGWMEELFGAISSGLNQLLPAGFFRSLIVDGILAGVGGVLVFLPNILLLFLGIALMEATGYMARAAFVIDKVMHRFGLHGKSFIPMITGFGCSVPAFMACRTLKSPSDRITTMLIIPFMSCGAKLPVYILLIGAFFPPAMAGNVLFGVYLFGVLLALIMARLLKKALFKNQSEPFVMELPPYRWPTLKSLLMQMYFKAASYIKKAGTIILFASVIIWLGTSFPVGPLPEEAQGAGEESETNHLEYTVAGRLGHIIEPVIKPLGFDWRVGVALTGGLAAKEIVVSTLATIYAVEETEEGSGGGTQGIQDALRADPDFTRATALSLMVFVLLYIPCLAATVVFHKEAGSWHWTRFYIIYTMVVAWAASFAVYRIASLWI